MNRKLIDDIFNVILQISKYMDILIVIIFVCTKYCSLFICLATMGTTGHQRTICHIRLKLRCKLLLMRHIYSIKDERYYQLDALYQIFESYHVLL